MPSSPTRSPSATTGSSPARRGIRRTTRGRSSSSGRPSPMTGRRPGSRRLTARGGVLAEGLRHADEIAELSPLDRRHAVRARDLLESWRDLKDRVPIATLVDRVLDESGYEAALLGEYLGAKKRANARKLV